MEYHYTFAKGSEYITAKGSGDDPHNLKGIKWVSSSDASGVLKQIMSQESGYSPAVGFVAFKNFPNDFYVQISRFGSLYKDGWRFKDTNLPAIPVESTELGKAKTKKRVYVKASAGRKAHYRTQEVGREEIKPVESIWEMTVDQVDRLVSGSKIPLQVRYIEDISYKPGDKHPKLEHLVSLMSERMQDLHSPPIFEEFTQEISMHDKAIWQALGDHESVPLRVLKDYPEAAAAYEIDISDEALAQEPPAGEITRLCEMPKDEYDAIIADVTKDYESDPLKITDAMLKKAYPQELEDTKRAARMRKKVFDNLPKQFKDGFCPETMNRQLHADIIQYAAVYGIDVPEKVKKDYPMLFKAVPIDFSPTGYEIFDKIINETLKEIKDQVLDPMAVGGVGSSGEIYDAVIDAIGSTFEIVPMDYGDMSDRERRLCEFGAGDISRRIGGDLLDRIKEYDGLPVTMIYDEERNRSCFQGDDYGTSIYLSKRILSGNSYNEETICHEYGHAIEHMVPEIQTLSNAFLDQRTMGDAMTPLSEVCPGMGYADNEVTRVDRFMSPYIGKHYPDRATEVLSMGMGYLTSEDAVERMYKEDPEYLGFIVAVMAGKIGSKKVEKGFIPNRIEINLSKLNN